MHEGNFISVADQLLDNIADIIEAKDSAGVFDVEYGSGVLTITTQEHNIYVLNKQTSKKEIWLSSPVSGPYHFGQTNGIWQDGKKNQLLEVLTKELKINFLAIISEKLDDQ